jgi:hypothetical protein
MTGPKALVRNSPLFPYARDIYGTLWALGHRAGLGKIPPPHAYKQHLVKALGKRHGLRTLVETGTWKGHMVDATARSFANIYTVELDDEHHEAAAARFADRSHIHTVHGDSGTLLPDIVAGLTGPALFWLDAHYSGQGTAGDQANPIEREIATVLTAVERGHVILIDDARDFNGAEGYPTIDRLSQLTAQLRPDLRLSVDADIVRIEPER